MKVLIKLLNILTKKQLGKCFLLVLLMILVAVFEACGIGLLYPLINIISTPDYLEKNKKLAEILMPFGIDTQKELILFATIGILLFYLLKNIIVLLQGKLQIAFSLNNQKEYTRRLYQNYMKKPYTYHLQTNLAQTSRNINVGGTVVFSDLMIHVFILLTNFVTTVVIIISVFIIDWISAIGIILILGPVVLLVLNAFRKKIDRYGEIKNKQQVSYLKWINQGFMSIKETKVMQSEPFFLSEFNKAYGEYTECQKNFLFINRIPRSVIELSSITGILFLIVIKIIFNSDLQSLIPTLGVLALAAVRLMPALNQSIGIINGLKFELPFFDSVYNDFLEIKEIKSEEENRSETEESKLTVKDDVFGPAEFTREISVENVSYKYPSKNQKVLNNVSFKINKGSFVGIIGESGAGKTTFVDVLLGLLPPDEGKILVDGKDIYENLSGWLNNVAYVPQSINLIDGSIKENVTFGLSPEEIHEERIAEVLKMAELYDFVESLPEKENTSVGDRGTQLSGGQKQRIGIARALYRNPKVLIFDEATSALDSETEKSITQTILQFKGKITIIAIAHRLSTLEECDYKIKFENGNASLINSN